MTSILIQNDTFEQLKGVALAQQVSPEDLAERAIREFLRSQARQQMLGEQQAFRERHAELVDQYPDEYVAVYRRQVVDHDRDQLALVVRIDERFPNQPVLITHVTSEVEEEYTIRSPRLEEVSSL